MSDEQFFTFATVDWADTKYWLNTKIIDNNARFESFFLFIILLLIQLSPRQSSVKSTARLI